MHRKTIRTPEIIDEICERMSAGEPLAAICRSEHMPGLRTVYDWAERDADLSARIARAREEGEDAIAAECLTIADNATNDWMERNGQDAPGYSLNGEHVQRSKLRIDTRLKLLAKWNPKKYGERLDHTSGGERLPAPTTVDLSALPAEVLRALLNANNGPASTD